MNQVIRKLWPLFRQIGLALIIFLITAVGFVQLADEVSEGETMEFDRQFLMMINRGASDLQDIIWFVITQLGGFIAVPVITTAIVLLLVKRRRYYKAVLLAAGVGGAALLNVILKLLFERSRPDLWEQIVVETSPSFPSGHAMASCALAVSLIFVTWSTKWRNLVIIGALVYVVLVGYSRLYLGVHYLTDVIAGWAASIAWVLLVAFLVYKFTGKLSGQRFTKDRHSL